MNDYVQKEVCAQIKNFPDILPSKESLAPSDIIPGAEKIKSEQVMVNSPSSLDKLDDSYYSYGMINFAPF